MGEELVFVANMGNSEELDLESLIDLVDLADCGDAIDPFAGVGLVGAPAVIDAGIWRCKEGKVFSQEECYPHGGIGIGDGGKSGADVASSLEHDRFTFF